MTRLAAILIRPRETIRSIVAGSRSSRVVLLLVLLATLSALVRSVRWQLYRESPRFAAMMPSAWIICAGLVGILIGALLLFYVFAWLVVGIGRLMGGTADGRTVRVVLAWSSAPLIWALLYRIPVALFQPALGATLDEPHNSLAAFHTAIAAMSLYALVSSAVIVFLTVAVDIWCFAIASVALSEVNGFSTWRAAATLCFSLLAPLIVVAAYFISSAV